MTIMAYLRQVADIAVMDGFTGAQQTLWDIFFVVWQCFDEKKLRKASALNI
jgi:hypothetical protein